MLLSVTVNCQNNFSDLAVDLYCELWTNLWPCSRVSCLWTSECWTRFRENFSALIKKSTHHSHSNPRWSKLIVQYTECFYIKPEHRSWKHSPQMSQTIQQFDYNHCPSCYCILCTPVYLHHPYHQLILIS